MPGATLMMGVDGEGVLDSQSLTVAYSGTTYGYISGLFGSISDGSSNIYGGASIINLSAVEATGVVQFGVSGIVANSGWTNMAIAGFGTFARTDATYQNSGGNSFWIWGSGSFPTSGTVTVTFS
jgi:hypothetical protein